MRSLWGVLNHRKSTLFEGEGFFFYHLSKNSASVPRRLAGIVVHVMKLFGSEFISIVNLYLRPYSAISVAVDSAAEVVAQFGFSSVLVSYVVVMLQLCRIKWTL